MPEGIHTTFEILTHAYTNSNNHDHSNYLFLFIIQCVMCEDWLHRRHLEVEGEKVC